MIPEERMQKAVHEARVKLRQEALKINSIISEAMFKVDKCLEDMQPK